MFASIGAALDEALKEATAEPSTGSATPRPPQQEPEDRDSCVVCLAAAMLFYFARGAFLLATAATLGVCWLSNPTASQKRGAAWPPLLSARQALLARYAGEKAANGSWGAALRATLVDGVRGALARRVFVDARFFSLALLDSAAPIDNAIFAVGCLGEWHVVVSPRLRAVAGALAGLPAAAAS